MKIDDNCIACCLIAFLIGIMFNYISKNLFNCNLIEGKRFGQALIRARGGAPAPAPAPAAKGGPSAAAKGGPPPAAAQNGKPGGENKSPNCEKCADCPRPNFTDCKTTCLEELGALGLAGGWIYDSLR